MPSPTLFKVQIEKEKVNKNKIKLSLDAVRLVTSNTCVESLPICANPVGDFLRNTSMPLKSKKSLSRNANQIMKKCRTQKMEIPHSISIALGISESI